MLLIDFRHTVSTHRLFFFVEQTAFGEILTGYTVAHPWQRLEPLRSDLLAAVGADAILLVLDALKGFINLKKNLPVVRRLAEEKLLRVRIRSLIRGILRGFDVGFATVIFIASDDASQSGAFRH